MQATIYAHQLCRCPMCTQLLSIAILCHTSHWAVVSHSRADKNIYPTLPLHEVGILPTTLLYNSMMLCAESLSRNIWLQWVHLTSSGERAC